MIDIPLEIDAIQREVATGRTDAGSDARVVRIRRTFPSPIEDVWDALTDPERIGRWFLPISGDVRLGGRYQFEGNAGGRILACDRPNRCKVTWEYGEGEPSTVELRLQPAGADATTLELEHIAVVPEEMWDQFGPGAVGTGWDGGFLGLALHLRGGKLDVDPAEWQVSDEGKDWSRRSSAEWGAANLAAGADPDTVARNIAQTTAFYTGEPPAA
jgi:uncharacterized protein YndB with AHSA1/START domain